MSRTNPISTEEFGTYTPQQQNKYLFLKLLDVEESNEQALPGIQSGGSNLEERVLRMAETLAGMSSWVQEMTMVFERLSGERAIQDSTVAVTLEALAKAAEDLRRTRVLTHPNRSSRVAKVQALAHGSAPDVRSTNFRHQFSFNLHQ
ncbi:hypothetical protein C8J57DRAFT_1255407 [Mycena rebaudengoi]|nr:hypothetical protein C8J57DRAFT_1255407 [Mycena rebaudengoi]